MTRVRWGVGVLAAVLIVLAAVGLPGRSAIQAGMTAYDGAQPQAAIDALLPRTEPRPSSTALYDAGTIWMEQGDAARALASWLAARDVAPRSDDLAHGIALARTQLSGAPAPSPALRPWMEVLTPGELGLLAVLAWAGMSWLARRARTVVDWVSVGGVLLLAAGLSAVALDGRAAMLTHPPAVTLEEAVARDAPELGANERFTLAPGAELRVQLRRKAFVLVTDGLGRRGWVLAETLSLGHPSAIARVPTE